MIGTTLKLNQVVNQVNNLLWAEKKKHICSKSSKNSRVCVLTMEATMITLKAKSEQLANFSMFTVFL